MTTLFLLLCGVIGAYQYFTNELRVRRQAEEYLARLTGGHVTVGSATLSIFEGLRIDDVRVYTDPRHTEDSRIFSAATFSIHYRPAALLQGRVEATRIVAIDPHVRLTEDVNTRRWNFAHLRPRSTPSTGPSEGPRVLPEIFVRNATVDYLVVGRDEPIGSVSIDGQFTPDPQRRLYDFKFQSRARSAERGPRAEGRISLASGQVSVTLSELYFNRDLLSMLPADARNWCQAHQLQGIVEEATLAMNHSAPDQPFQANIQIRNGALTVQPDELLSAEEIQRRQWAREAFHVMQNVGLDDGGFVTHLSDLLEAGPIALVDVDGTFTFTEKGVAVKQLYATVDDNRFVIQGHSDGYSNNAAAAVELSNAPKEYVRIRPNPRFINSLPAEVREVYSRFRPQGTCEVTVGYLRRERGARPEVTCDVRIRDGSFVFEKIPYPIHHAQGRIWAGRDPQTGLEQLLIDHVRGIGIPGGPNQNSTVEINGKMGPFTPDMEVEVTVRGENLSSEPALMAAFPPKTRRALTFFDAPGKGEWPQFRGDFVCTIHRSPHRRPRWSVETAIQLREATGSLVAFPYPMEKVTGELIVSDDHLVIKEARYRQGDAELLIKGQVSWGEEAQRESKDGSPRLRPDLSIVARNVPIDDKLLEALPPLQAHWLRRLGAAGRFDLSGKVTMGEDRPDFQFDVAMKDCSLWPIPADASGTAQRNMLTDVSGTLKLTPTMLTLSDLRGKRGASDVTAHGEVRWPTSPPTVSIITEAKDLVLDKELFDMLPEAAQRGWTTVQPEGTVDTRIVFTGATRPAPLASAVDVGPTTRAQDHSFEVTLIPRKLSITPRPVPYRIDDLSGQVTITPSTVRLQDVAGRHGQAQVRISGSGSTEENGAWEFQLAGEHLQIDDDFRKAIPTGLQSLVESTKMQGAVAFEFPMLRVWTEPDATTRPATSPHGSRDSRADVNVDFNVKVTLDDALLDPGVTLTGVNGGGTFTGAARRGKLTDLTGRLEVASLEIAGRPATNLRADLVKRPNAEAMKLANLQAQFVGGQLAGQIEWETADTTPGRYAMTLVLHNADVKALTGDNMPDVQGALSASLAMEGRFNDVRSRRGGGDVSVVGEQLYRMPLVLGLLQITNLSFPISSPFEEGTCKYMIDGQRVTFDTIELRAKDMTMSGNGQLDFGTRKVAMTFATESSGWLKLPVVKDLLAGARNELLQIHVRGTIEEPKFSGRSMNTFMTTVDEVFKGGAPSPKQ